jgi:hypothetical protein
MKTIIKILFLVFFVNTLNAQIINIDGIYTPMDAPTGSYLKDINHTFDPFLGTWKYQNGNQILIIKLEKVEMYLNTEYGVYEDFIKGNYSYSTDGGLTYIVNNIQQNLGNNDPNVNPIFSCGPDTPLEDKVPFYDVVYQKNAWAIFTFQSGNFNQIHLKLQNKGGGYIYPATPPNPAFCIPNNVILIKQ